MFTGIIQSVGEIREAARHGADLRVRVAAGGLDLRAAAVGDSIAVSGVCLTAIELTGDGFTADVSAETLACTTAGEWRAGARVNLEKALTLQTPLGGHLVSGHVDGTGVVKSRRDEGRSVRFVIEAPDALARYIAVKGSICVDGVSLTVNAVEGAAFDVNIVPHTLRETTFGEYAAGRRMNLEVDIVARYLERLLLGERAASTGGGITRELLERHGYLPGN